MSERKGLIMDDSSQRIRGGRGPPRLCEVRAGVRASVHFDRRRYLGLFFFVVVVVVVVVVVSPASKADTAAACPPFCRDRGGPKKKPALARLGGRPPPSRFTTWSSKI